MAETCCTEIVLQKNDELVSHVEIVQLSLSQKGIVIESHCTQGPRGAQGLTGPPGVGSNLPSLVVNVAANSTKQIDSIDASISIAGKWLVSIEQGLLIKNCEVHGNRISYSVFAIMGSAIASKLTVSENNGFLSLNIINNTATAFIVKATRISVNH